MEQFAAIRRDHRVEGLSIGALADRHRVHRRTVRQALESAVPPARKTPLRVAPRLEPFRAAIDDMLRSDLDARRSNVTRREGFWPGWSTGTARRACRIPRCAIMSVNVARRSPRRRVGVGGGVLPQTHSPAAEAEVDFHDLWVVLCGVKTKTALFTMRLSFSGRAAHRAFATQGQEAFLEGHVYAFERLGGVPSAGSATTTSTARSSRCCSGGRVRRTALDCVSFALRFRSLVLPARSRGQPREGWRGR